MRRTFIAIKIDPGAELLKLFSALKKELGIESVKWTDPGQIHITLAFLGDTSDKSISEVSTMLHSTCSSKESFSFDISGIGVFRNINDARVIWAGIKNSEELGSLFTVVKTGLENIGISLEDRAFRPHITLGRVRRNIDRNLLERLVKQYDRKLFQKAEVREVIYFESILRPEGALYIPVSIVKFRN